MTSTRLDEVCRWTRWQVCRMAVGRQLGEGARDLARHVRGCRDCDRFVDDVAALRGFLLRGAPRRPTLAQVRRHARQALARELAARLARDLLAGVRGEASRPAPACRRDLDRLGLLRREAGLRAADLREARRLLVAGEPVDADDVDELPRRRRLLGLASRLDPQGLDVALAWMGYLVRSGRDGQAQLVADQVLSDWQL